VPRYRVAVFLNDAASGATLGYFGMLLGVRSRRQHTYSVHIPALDQVVEVHQADLLVVGQDELHLLSEAESAWYLAEQKWEVQFESPLEQDNVEVWGSYRIGTREKGRFVFKKRIQSVPTFRFTIPAQGSPGMGKLQYFVPADCALNRNSVMLALSEILDVELPADDGGESPVVISGS